MMQVAAGSGPKYKVEVDALLLRELRAAETDLHAAEADFRAATDAHQRLLDAWASRPHRKLVSNITNGLLQSNVAGEIVTQVSYHIYIYILTLLSSTLSTFNAVEETYLSSFLAHEGDGRRFPQHSKRRMGLELQRILSKPLVHLGDSRFRRNFDL
jgi:hypothetical protein